MSRTDLEARLVRMGEEPGDGPDPSFVFELEARLRDLATGPAVVAVADVRGSSRRPLAGVLAAAAVIAAVVGFAVAGPRDLSVRTQNPASSSEDADDGGRTGTDSGQSPSVSADDKDDNGSSDTTAERRGTGGRAPSKDGAASSSDETSPSGSSTSSPRVSEAEPKSMQLEGQSTTTGAALTWSRYSGTDFAYYHVLRSKSPDDPEWPPTDRRKTAVVYASDDRDATKWSDTAISTSAVRYMVIVVDRSGQVVAKSNVVEVRGSAEAPIRLPARLPAAVSTGLD